LPKEKPQSVFVLGDFRVDFGIRAFEVRARVERRTTVPGTRDVDDVRVAFFDEAIQVNVDEVLTRRGSPVPEQRRFDLLRTERFA
jgi:hypothetical protein